MNEKPRYLAYYYPGWHPCPTRQQDLNSEFSEWDLVLHAKPHFEEHVQPNIPLWGPLDDSLPENFSKKINTATTYGIHGFIFAFYWSRKKQILQSALNSGFLGTPDNRQLTFALMWANRMPRNIIPVKDPDAALINPQRLVYTDPQDFQEFITFIAQHYFTKSNYLMLNSDAYLSIFDTTFFINQLGFDDTKYAIRSARQWLKKNHFPNIHLAAIDPIPAHIPHLQELGFNSITHYVKLPQWKGEYLQSYSQAAKAASKNWLTYKLQSQLPYFPSISAGWDATPRSVEFGKEKPKRYPWWPIVTDRTPDRFEQALQRGARFTLQHNQSQPYCFIASWNEWSEGHYLEPDSNFEYQWLKAVKSTGSS